MACGAEYVRHERSREMAQEELQGESPDVHHINRQPVRANVGARAAIIPASGQFRQNKHPGELSSLGTDERTPLFPVWCPIQCQEQPLRGETSPAGPYLSLHVSPCRHSYLCENLLLEI